MTATQRRSVAFHEAGHAVVMLAFELHFEKASITPDDPTKLGCVECIPGVKPTGDEGRLVRHLHETVADLAGSIAGGRVLSGMPFTPSGGGGGDLDDDYGKAIWRCQTIVNDFRLAQLPSGGSITSSVSPEAEEIHRILYLAAVAFVEERWRAIEAVANGLLESGELTEAQIVGICARVDERG